MTASEALLGRLLAGHTGTTEEAEVLGLLRAMSASELDRVLGGPLAARLFSSLDDRLLGPDNRAALLHLVRERVQDIGLGARAGVIHALQTGFTNRGEEEQAADLLCDVHGDALTHLKNLVNARNDRHDLEGLVFRDIGDEGVRRRILDHFAAEEPQQGEEKTKVLSDIDDTVFCALHDRRYPKGTLYPGVLAFQEALDRGPHDEESDGHNLTFVTARPADVLGLVERHSRSSLRAAGVTNLAMLSGSVFSLLSLDAMAGKKVENIGHYIQLFPEYRMSFMGDSGQGDVKVGQKIWQLYGDDVDAVFIHDVVDTPRAARQAYARQHIWFHDTYVGAANRALELGLIAPAGRERVAAETRQGFDHVAWESAGQEQRMRELLERDLG